MTRHTQYYTASKVECTLTRHTAVSTATVANACNGATKDTEHVCCETYGWEMEVGWQEGDYLVIGHVWQSRVRESSYDDCWRRYV